VCRNDALIEKAREFSMRSKSLFILSGAFVLTGAVLLTSAPKRALGGAPLAVAQSGWQDILQLRALTIATSLP
jgi:hypothetical protein